MDYSLKHKIEQVTKNKYEAVIVAAKLARRINNKRVAADEQMGPDDVAPTYKLKVTTEAIIELAKGDVKYAFKKDTESEEDIFPE
jgi:DNA-directed RNA polymerase subunit K/omega